MLRPVWWRALGRCSRIVVWVPWRGGQAPGVVVFSGLPATSGRGAGGERMVRVVPRIDIEFA